MTRDFFPEIPAKEEILPLSIRFNEN